MPPLLSEEEMDVMSSVYESDNEPMSTEMLEDIIDGSKSHTGIHRRDTRYKICDCIKQRWLEWKGAFLSTRNIGKGLHKVFKASVNNTLQVLPIFGEYG